MFNNDSGHHIHGGICYNFGGNVNLRNLQTYHGLNGHSCRVAFQSQPESTWGLESERSPQQPTIQDHLREVGHYGRPAGSRCEWEEPLRSEHRGSLGPYGALKVTQMMQVLRYSSDAGTRRRGSQISVDVVDQQRARPSSMSSGDLLGSFPADLRLHSTSSLEPLQSDPMMQLVSRRQTL
ncbi:hypothetical protein B0H14DRAFT_2570552 [Mycena olivaceomarginata]|jgi:hypothetical protein|nr:hypothetical protein B0H14DRAFT_2570552 [Mycena olivaceomarginata]